MIKHQVKDQYKNINNRAVSKRIRNILTRFIQLAHFSYFENYFLIFMFIFLFIVYRYKFLGYNIYQFQQCSLFLERQLTISQYTRHKLSQMSQAGLETTTNILGYLKKPLQIYSLKAINFASISYTYLADLRSCVSSSVNHKTKLYCHC